MLRGRILEHEQSEFGSNQIYIVILFFEAVEIEIRRIPGRSIFAFNQFLRLSVDGVFGSVT